MKKLTRSTLPASRLAVRGETLRVLRELSLRELHDGRVVGGSGDNCDGSTLAPLTNIC